MNPKYCQKKQILKEIKNYEKEAKVVSFQWDGTQLKMYSIVKRGRLYVGGSDENTRIVDIDDLEVIGRTARELFPLSK